MGGQRKIRLELAVVACLILFVGGWIHKYPGCCVCVPTPALFTYYSTKPVRYRMQEVDKTDNGTNIFFFLSREPRAGPVDPGVLSLRDFRWDGVRYSGTEKRGGGSLVVWFWVGGGGAFLKKK